MKPPRRIGEPPASLLTLETTWGTICVTARNGRVVACDLPFQSMENIATKKSSQWKPSAPETSSDWKKPAAEVSNEWNNVAAERRTKITILKSRVTNSRSAIPAEDRRVLRDAEGFIRALFSGRRAKRPPVVLPKATVFTKSIWRELLKIPCGQTLTYGEIAAKAGRPRAARAAGSACGANQIPLFVPCHRVLGANGAPGGFSSGLAWKRLLLQCEGVLP